jgi:hypothetical protein
MAVTVRPQSFEFVHFDADAIAKVTAQVQQRLGMDADVTVEVDETTPLSRVTIVSQEPLVIRAESGAFEDTRRPRHQSDESVARSIGRTLLRLRDRQSGGFEAAPDEADLTLAQHAAWDAYVMGRLDRLGYHQHRPRWLYNFRNRHGFTDQADRAFDRLWDADALDWPGVEAISREAVAARSPA